MVPVFRRLVANGQLKKGLSGRAIQRLSDVQVKAVTGHAVQRAPIGPGDSAREIANDVKNIVRKLHGVEKLKAKNKDSIL